MEEKILVGYHQFHSNKKNEDYLVADCLCSLTDRDRQQGYVGAQKAEQIFIPKELWHLITEDIIGKTLVFQYSISGRYVNLVGISVKK